MRGKLLLLLGICCFTFITTQVLAQSQSISTQPQTQKSDTQCKKIAKNIFALSGWKGKADTSQLDGCNVQTRTLKTKFYEYKLYRTIAKHHCGFPTGYRKGPADGEYYTLDCAVVCGESGGKFYPDNGDGFGQWIDSSWNSWRTTAETYWEKKLENRYHISLSFGSSPNESSPLEQQVIGWLSSGHDTWYGWKPPSNCR